MQGVNELVFLVITCRGQWGLPPGLRSGRAFLSDSPGLPALDLASS